MPESDMQDVNSVLRKAGDSATARHVANVLRVAVAELESAPNARFAVPGDMYVRTPAGDLVRLTIDTVTYLDVSGKEDDPS